MSRFLTEVVLPLFLQGSSRPRYLFDNHLGLRPVTVLLGLASYVGAAIGSKRCGLEKTGWVASKWGGELLWGKLYSTTKLNYKKRRRLHCRGMLCNYRS